MFTVLPTAWAAGAMLKPGVTVLVFTVAVVQWLDVDIARRFVAAVVQ